MNKVGINQIHGLGVVKKWKSLRTEIEKSKKSKSKRMHTLCKDFNIKQNNAQSWLMLEDYSYETEPFNLEDFRGSFFVWGQLIYLQLLTYQMQKYY